MTKHAGYNGGNSPQFGLHHRPLCHRASPAPVSPCAGRTDVPARRRRQGAAAAPAAFGGAWRPGELRRAALDAVRCVPPRGQACASPWSAPMATRAFPAAWPPHHLVVWTQDNRLIVDCGAVTIKPTVVNFTQRQLFQPLAGAGGAC